MVDGRLHNLVEERIAQRRDAFTDSWLPAKPYFGLRWRASSPRWKLADLMASVLKLYFGCYETSYSFWSSRHVTLDTCVPRIASLET